MRQTPWTLLACNRSTHTENFVQEVWSNTAAPLLCMHIVVDLAEELVEDAGEPLLRVLWIEAPSPTFNP